LPSTDDRCTLRSLAADEPLAGTASQIRRWLLIEHDGPWGRDGLVDARLPEGVGRALAATAARSRARVLLVRRTASIPAPAGDRRLSCFAIDTRDAWIGARPLERIEDATALDPRDRSAFDPAAGPLFVVCTHGRRDVCCAERGRPVAQALAAEAPAETWESTHVGGDRFAANVVAFPHGVFLGRVRPADASELASGYADGRIAPLDRFRGRTRDPFDVQAAEASLRIALGLDRIREVEAIGRARTLDRSEVTFRTPDAYYRIELERVPGPPTRLTCRSGRDEIPWTWVAGPPAALPG
jgi:hypothetical protein